MGLFVGGWGLEIKGLWMVCDSLALEASEAKPKMCVFCFCIFSDVEL